MTAIDWAQVGYAPVGADLATFAMWVDTPMDELVAAYIRSLAAGAVIAPSDVWAGVRTTTALIAVSRAIRVAASGQTDSGYYRRLNTATPALIAALADRQ